MSQPLEFSLKTLVSQPDFGRFVLEVLPPSFGHTLGNSLRRVLLAAIPGAAPIQMKIGGVNHLFTVVRGVKEDGVELMLNIKKICFDYRGKKPIVVKLEKKGPGEVKAGDFQLPTEVKITNPELVIAHLSDKNTRLRLAVKIARGVGIEFAEDHKSNVLGWIPIDAVFTPVRKVSYRVEPVRVGRRANFERLILEVWTNKTVTPKEALSIAVEILKNSFERIRKGLEEKEEDETAPRKKKEAVQEAEEKLENLLVEELEELPTRLINTLKKAGYKKIVDLIQVAPSELLKLRNVGPKSVELIYQALRRQGVRWTKYETQKER